MFLPNCTDISRHDNDRIRTRAKIVRKWYDDNNIIIYTGRIHPSKGIFDLAKAYDKVAEKYPGTKLLLAGVLQLTYDDEDGSECYRKILECISEDKHKDVHHLGWIEDKGMLACYLAASDVFVLPSYHENFSTSVLEALAMGTPSVVGDVDGSHEVFVAPGYAWGCEPKDHEGLAETLDHILSNKDRVVPMARQIQAEVNRRFNHERVFGRTMDYYRTLRA
jgi:glycosyltransferase involved in cell wall biosynthesis